MEEMYEAWIRHVFDHPVEKNQWFFDVDAPVFNADEKFETDDLIMTRLLHQTFVNCSALTETYSDEQTGQGFLYILDPACSSYAHILKNDPVPAKTRTEVLLSMKHLYKDLFNERCTSIISFPEKIDNPLNYLCNMLWDITTLSYWEDLPESTTYYQALSEVMEFGLSQPNIACKEGALHGLGHLQLYYPKRVEEIIDRFLWKEKNIPAGLLAYAQHARIGMIL